MRFHGRRETKVGSEVKQGRRRRLENPGRVDQSGLFSSARQEISSKRRQRLQRTKQFASAQNLPSLSRRCRRARRGFNLERGEVAGGSVRQSKILCGLMARRPEKPSCRRAIFLKWIKPADAVQPMMTTTFIVDDL